MKRRQYLEGTSKRSSTVFLKMLLKPIIRLIVIVKRLMKTAKISMTRMMFTVEIKSLRSTRIINLRTLVTMNVYTLSHWKQRKIRKDTQSMSKYVNMHIKYGFSKQVSTIIKVEKLRGMSTDRIVKI